MRTTQSFLEFRGQIEAQGFDRLTPKRIMGELAIFVIATLAGIGILISTDYLLLQALAMLIITLASMGVSTNAHTASHNAVSDTPWVNRALTFFGYPFFLQVSASFWRQKHLVIHHPHPNQEGVDYDADLSPYFALTENEVRRAGRLHRWLYRYQWFYLPLFLVGNGLNVVLSGWAYLLRKLADPKARSAQHWVDLGMLLLHYVVWVGIPMLIFSATDVILFALVRFALISYAMFALFAPAHFPSEALMIEPDASDLDLIHKQTLTTVNYRTGWLGRLLCGGVEYQIEHHLFPSVSPTHYPRLSKWVRAYCEEHGYPYRTLGWGEAIWKSFLAFFHPKPVVSNLSDALVATKAEGSANSDMACGVRRSAS